MNVLVINSGSSSIKFQLIAMPSAQLLASGMVERIGISGGKIHFETPEKSFEEEGYIGDHGIGLKKIADLLLDAEKGVLKTVDDVHMVGHRVVHGGRTFSKTVEISEEVKNKIRDLSSLAPLHNPHNLRGIEVAEHIFTNAKQVAVFDTAFHQTIPQKAHQYAIPLDLYENHGVRLYGFHGTSHKYVSKKAIAYLDKNETNIITIHLGNGCSMSAIKNGVCIDHSLGFSPVNGLIMGTRSGDIDQSIIFYLIDKMGYTAANVNEMLNTKSGMYGLTGLSDLRDIEAEAEDGDAQCQMALAMNAYRIKKYIGAYTAALNGLDAIVFTAGIGENSSYLRNLICTDMDYLGIKLDTEKNNIRSKTLRAINTEDSLVKILIVPTNEELEIAEQVYALHTKAN